MAVGSELGGAPLGAIVDGGGVTFALFSAHAEAVEVCIFDAAEPARETARVALARGTDAVWRGRVAGCGAGTPYGYRVHGPYAPREGHRFNPAKLLLDPYARAITPLAAWSDELLGYAGGGDDADLVRDERDDAAVAPRAVVVDPSFDWGDDRAPRTPWERTLIYEAHVKGMTARHRGVPAADRGTYAGLAAPALLEHLVALGVTAVELLPVQHAISERHLARHGLTNYWGYNTIGFFAPDARFAPTGRGEQVREFQAMVRALHAVGIEVILDVVYNHTAEGDQLGPTLAFRGIDNRSYYRLVDGDPGRYVNFTGCGNTLDLTRPPVLALVLDSLRYWVETMHVDGFRFDLASALARNPDAFDPDAPFLAAVRSDPVLATVKLIAEPWDATAEGYRAGQYPPPWREWNDRFRDTTRRWWRGDQGQAGALAVRVAGSPDLYGAPERGPTASVNFVTAHDGFSLRDLVSYANKHNEDNGEDNRDGADENWSWNGGVEGPTDDRAILALRARQQRTILATLLLSQGVPMVRAGDEIGQTQGGNNNAYCQDNARTWLDWELDDERRALLAFVRRVIGLVRRHPGFRRAEYFAGARAEADDLVWYAASGVPLAGDAWHDAERRTLGVLLRPAPPLPAVGTTVCGASPLFLVLNAAADPVTFTLPDVGTPWATLVDSAEPDAHTTVADAGRYLLAARSLVVLAPRPAPIHR